MQTLIVDGDRTYKQIPVVRIECTVAYRRVETIRSRWQHFVKAHIINPHPEQDESHAATRYREAGR